MILDLLMQILLIKTVRSISAKMVYYVLFTKILQGGDTNIGLFFTKEVLEFVVKILESF